MLAPALSVPPSSGAKRKPDEADVPSKLYRRADGTADAADAVMADAPPQARMSIFGQAAATSARHTEETDAHKVAQRSKQIEHGRNTLAYDRYTRLVPRRRRDKNEPSHLRTPNPREPHISKRQFDGRLREWRRKLHEFWDPVDSLADAATGGAAAHSPPGVADPASARFAPPRAASGDRAGLVGSEAPFSLDDYLDSGEVDTALVGLVGSIPAVPAAHLPAVRAPATVECGRAVTALSAQTPRTCSVPKTAPMLSAAGASHAAAVACPVMPGLSPAGPTPTNSSRGARRSGADAPLADTAGGQCRSAPDPALTGSEAAGFDLDAYLGDELWGAFGQEVAPRLPQPKSSNSFTRTASGAIAAAAGSGIGGGGVAPASGASAVRARLDTHKTAGRAECASNIYASWDGDDALVG